MKRLIILSLCLGACGGWTRKDTLLEIANAGVTAVDWHQTEKIVYFCQEQNPIIGVCGDRAPVDIYMPSMILVHAGISMLLPPKYRTLWQAVSLGIESETVYSNYASGYDTPPTVILGGQQVPYQHGEH